MSSVSEWRTTPSARARRCGGHAAVDVHGEHEGVESSTDHMSEAEADRSGTFLSVSSRTAAPSAARAAVFESRINQNGAEAQAGSWSQRTTRWRATRARARRCAFSICASRRIGESITCLFIIATEKVPNSGAGFCGEGGILPNVLRETSSRSARSWTGMLWGRPFQGRHLLAMRRCTCILRETSSRPASECPSIDTAATMRGSAPRQCSETASSNATRGGA